MLYFYDMEKTDIYEHLAHIYLDTPLRKKNQLKNQPPQVSKKYLYISLAIIACLAILLSIALQIKRKPLTTQNSSVLQPDVIKINYHFNTGKKEVYSLNLKKADLSKFKQLAFFLKKANNRDTISIRVEFANAFKEKGEIYIKDVAKNWKLYKLDLADFKGITDWTEILELSFIIEEWNTQDKDGAVYIESVTLFR
ncbi:MAG: hypothetical protein KKD79_04950 [Candidatus Omnitrophica bacterium]|nr:hypothetical protein [Candidatus Omnitrophota bacterium]MBU1929182.1 hypothetical protein [Candidatus Omnitrophota bacterium]